MADNTFQTIPMIEEEEKKKELFPESGKSEHNWVKNRMARRLALGTDDMFIIPNYRLDLNARKAAKKVLKRYNREIRRMINKQLDD